MRIKTKHYTEVEIIEGCCKNDRFFQQYLYDMYKRRFYAICMRYTHDMAEAEDILQDGFVKIFKSMDSFTRAGSFEGWMKRIIVNTAIEYFRKRTNLYSITEFEHAESVSYDEQTIENIAAGDILKLIKELPIGYRTVFNLYAIEGFSHKEIGDMLEISEGTSKSQLARARGILQQKVNDLFNNEKKNIS